MNHQEFDASCATLEAVIDLAAVSDPNLSSFAWSITDRLRRGDTSSASATSGGSR